MSAGPRILLTNDDGVDAPGLKVLRAIAESLTDDIWIVAPADNQSGAGHRFTLGHELTLDARGKRTFAVNGTPADCVVAAITHVLADKRPDIVLSGVNNGQNLGDIIHCSGTVAAAREGALHGALSIAMSQAVDYDRKHDVDWTNSLRAGAAVVRAIQSAHESRHVYYNVNFPLAEADAPLPLRVVPHQRFEQAAFGYYPSHNAGKFFITIPETPSPLDPAHDFHVLHQDRAITLTPLTLMHSDAESVRRLDGALQIEL